MNLVVPKDTSVLLAVCFYLPILLLSLVALLARSKLNLQVGVPRPGKANSDLLFPFHAFVSASTCVSVTDLFVFIMAVPPPSPVTTAWKFTGQ